MMEAMVGPAMAALRNMTDDGSLEYVEEIEEILCNADLESLFSAAGAPAATGGGAVVDRKLIQRLQGHLETLGYGPGNTGGELDTRTRIAISQFQAEHGYPVTGEPSAGLVADLAAEVARQGA